jgi:methylated-DNA-protein-cysteine methyltransferase-like protein
MLTACLFDSALRFLQDDTVPWWRVLSASGKISPRGDAGEGADRQRRVLEDENIEVVDDPGGSGHGGKVDLRRYGWFPDVEDELDGDGDRVE